MIALEEKEQKYNLEKHKVRLQGIIDNWNHIKHIIDEELPSYAYMENLFKKLGMPTTLKEIGIDTDHPVKFIPPQWANVYETDDDIGCIRRLTVSHTDVCTQKILKIYSLQEETSAPPMRQ